jgi:hypothetical protein
VIYFVSDLIELAQGGFSPLQLALTYAGEAAITGTVLYAIVERTPDWEALVVRLGSWLDVHSVLMVVAGIAFGVAVARAGVVPRWTGWTLVAGMVLMAVTAAMPDVVRTLSAGVRDLAFAAMGVAVLRRSREHDPASS